MYIVFCSCLTRIRYQRVVVEPYFISVLLTYVGFYCAMLCMRGTSHGPVSVSLSVTSRSFTKTARCRITQMKPHDSPGTVVFWCQRSPRNSTGVTPYEGAKCRWGWKNRRLLTNNISKTVKDRHMLSIKVE